MQLGLKEKNVLIVGASKGIGKAIAVGFAKEEANLVLVARTESILKEVEKESIYEGAKSCSVVVKDIMKVDTKKFADALINKFGVFDIIIHNVGGSLIPRDPLSDSKAWEYALKFNALAAIDMNSVFLSAMLVRGQGKIIHISSISAKMLRGNPLYASSKAFLNAYVTSVGREVAAKGICLCSVMPGAIAFAGSYWDKLQSVNQEKCQDFLRHHQGIGRFGAPEEIANAVVFLASEKASFLQGANIPVDGANM